MSAPEKDEGRMPLTEHLRELRDRLVTSVVAYAVAFAICYYYSDALFAALKYPLDQVMSDAPTNTTLAVTSLSEGFMVGLKVAGIAAFFLASPVFLHQIWKFVAPGLYETERALAIPAILAFSLLFMVGAIFGYFVVLPYVFSFFLSTIGPGVLPALSVADFLEVSSKMLLMFGLVFELPVVCFFLARLGVIKAEQMVEYRKYAIVIIFVIGAFLTPPDPVSQVLVSVPLVGLYQVGIWVARLAAKPAEAQAATEA